MDYIKNIDLNKYIMSLDNLDLALLPNIYDSKLKNMPKLWTVNHPMLTDDYFEFEVKRKTESVISTNNDSTTINDTVSDNSSHQNLINKSRLIPTYTATTICHLCDIDVPKAYLADHENSLKHKAHLKLADVVLNRTRKHMLKQTTDNSQKNDKFYFCEPCASEIQLLNKPKHEKSKAHKQSVALDRLLHELVALYADEDHERESNEVANMKTNNTSDQEDEINNNSNIIVNSDIRARLDELEMKTVENYIKMVDECDEDKSYVLSSAGNDVRISMANGLEIVVTENNFNGYVRIDENFTMCIVCKTVVDSEKTHKTTDTHIKNIVTLFKDHHCLRNLDSSNFHCVICNKIVNNSDLHILCDETHSELLHKAIVVEENKAKEPPQNNIFINNNETYKNIETDNNVCNKNEPNKNNETDSTVYNGFAEEYNYDNISKDTEGNRLLKSLTITENKSNVTEIKPTTNDANSTVVHEPNIKNQDDDTYHCFPCNIKIHVNNITSHVNGNKHAMNSKSKFHYLIKQDVGSNYLLCRVCHTYVTDDVNKVQEHATTSDHLQRYKELLSANYMLKKKNSFLCEPCNMVIHKRNELYHIEKINHEVMLQHFKNAKDQSVDKSAKTGEIFENHNIIETVNNDSKLPEKKLAYYCTVCNVYVPNNPSNITDHNKGLRHNNNALKLAVEYTDAVESNSSVDNLDLHYQMDATENEKSLMCKVCKVVVPNIDSNITEHTVGKKHDVLLKGIVDANNMEHDGEKYYCKDCELYVKTHNLFTHINSKRHQKLLGSLDPKAESIEAVNSPDSVTKPCTSETNINSETIDTLYLKFKHHFKELDNKEWLQCKVCFDMDIPNTAEAVATHTGTDAHTKTYTTLMANNYIYKTDEQLYFCGVCLCLVPLKGEVQHATGQRHAANYTNFTPPKHVSEILENQTLLHYCKFCKSLMHKDKAEEHPKSCHKFVVKDKICFCTSCDPYLPGTDRQ